MPRKQLKDLFQYRDFLNQDMSMSAFIIASVEEFSKKQYKGSVSGYPTLDIGDCSNKVSLDFCFFGEEGMKEKHAKAKKLREAVNGFCDAFDAEVAAYEAEQAKKVKAKKTVKRKVNAKSA
jgi:hypothetical protein